MESLPSRVENFDENPENAGELEASKKKRKKTRIPLKKTVKKETGTDAPKEEAPDLRPKTLANIIVGQKKGGIEEDKSNKSSKEKSSEEEELVLPEPSDAEGFSGELVIDHADEAELSADATPEEQAPDPFEALLETAAAPEADNASVVEEAATLIPENDVTETDSEPDTTRPPAVAPPFIISTGNIPQAEVEAATLDVPITYPTFEQPGPSRLRGRLSEEWAEVRRRSNAEEPLVAESSANRRAYYAEKRGLSRGVVSGGLVGYLLGRRGKRALEREARAAVESRDKAIKDLVKDRDVIRDESSEHLNVLRRTQNELAEMMRRTKEGITINRAEITPQIQATRVVEVPAPLAYEKLESEPTPPKRPLEPYEIPKFSPENSEEIPKLKPEVAPEHQTITEETYKAPEGRRVETSAWHRIEVDEKTGHAVENPSVAYGEAFKREQSAEKLARDAAKVQTAAQVGMTLLSGGTDQPVAPLASSKGLPKQKPASPKNDVREDVAYAARQVAQGVTRPATWGVALAIVVLLFLLGIL